MTILELMKILYKAFNNYGIAIIVLTILVRAVTFPFTYMSMKSMKAMQRLQPEMKRLKEVYKDNTQAFNQEMMKLYKENKVNPAGGCLPILLQMPIFWALYQVLQNSVELYHSPFIGWIHDLSIKDPFYVLPVLMSITMVIQQKITPSTIDPAQARVMMFMPVFFGFLMMSLPAGLTLYIFVSTLFGIIQQILMLQDRGKDQQVALVRRT
jgi:YidC/Oxa1 family membrane protein insertase